MIKTLISKIIYKVSIKQKMYKKLLLFMSSSSRISFLEIRFITFESYKVFKLQFILKFLENTLITIENTHTKLSLLFTT